MRTPFSTNEPAPSEPLFGRDAIIDHLLASAKRGDNLSLTGIRRVGKTTLVKRVCHLIKNDSINQAYPVYIDVKEAHVKGTAGFYQLLIARILSQLYCDKIFTTDWVERNISIEFSEDSDDIHEQIEKIRLAKCQSILGRIVEKAFECQHKTLIIVFDEYECIFKNILDLPAGFMKIRSLSSMPADSDGLCKFAFWVVGSKRWDVFCDEIGSGEANTIECCEYVEPLSQSDFTDMWEYECQALEDSFTRSKIQSYSNRAFRSSGGVPFFGKLIGGAIVRNGSYPSFEICQAHFAEIIQSCTPEQCEVLGALREGAKEYRVTNGIIQLQQVGLLSQDSIGKLIIPISFLVDYLVHDSDLDELHEAESTCVCLSNEIEELMEFVNKQQQLNQRAPIFKMVTDYASTVKDLRIEVTDKKKYALFSLALYRILYEWTKQNGKTRQSLFDVAYRFGNHNFIQNVDINRHTFGGAHEEDVFETLPGKKTKSNLLLEMRGIATLPHAPREYSLLQLEFLKQFKSFLETLKDAVISKDTLVSVRSTIHGSSKQQMCNLSGKIDEYCKKAYISDRWYYNIKTFAANCAPDTYFYNTDENIIFDLIDAGEDPQRPSQRKYKAINVRPEQEQ